MRPASASGVGVQEDREPECREPLGELVDEPLGVLVQRVVERHHGDDVERADVRVHAVVCADVDALDRDCCGGDQTLAESTRRAARGEHGAVVVGVDVDVQHPRAAAFERIAECVQRAPVAALAEVGDCLERQHRDVA